MEANGNEMMAEMMIDMYKEGYSLYAIARNFHTYPTTVRRTLLGNGVELRHDKTEKGKAAVKGGEELIEWAKSQGRYVTKAELAKHLGKSRLSPSYFEKYPELGKYVKGHGQQEVKEYTNKLYKFLADNDIPYKPNDRTRLNVTVTALLLGEYSNIAIQLDEKASCVSVTRYNYMMNEKSKRASEAGVRLLLLHKEDLEDLDNLKATLEILKFQSV